MRLIDAEVLKQHIDKLPALPDGNFAGNHSALKALINKQPTIQLEPKTGKWIGTEFDGYADGNPVFYEWQCSECGCIFEDEEPIYKFCPNCGVDMKGAKHETN